jgi:hypothetical protein
LTVARRPISVSLLAVVYVLTGMAGLAVHFREFLARQPDTVWIELTELLAILIGVFLFRGHDWARWLALAWIAFHVALSVFDSVRELAVHSAICALIAWILFRPAAARYFRPVPQPLAES